MTVVANFGGVMLANRVSLALIKRDVEALKENDKDKETRLRVCERHVAATEGR
jgi:type III secretory pathway lipoprotein EscJ